MTGRPLSLAFLVAAVVVFVLAALAVTIGLHTVDRVLALGLALLAGGLVLERTGS